MKDVEKALEISSLGISKIKLEFKPFLKQVIEPLVEQLGYKDISRICEGVYLSFKDRASSSQCLEYLCFIYEKKMFNENRLNTSYVRLLEMDPSNIKALKYFKVLYGENQKWHKVSEVLEKLYESSKHPTDKYKFALELASIFVYQLDEPEKAISIIETNVLIHQSIPLPYIMMRIIEVEIGADV